MGLQPVKGRTALNDHPGLPGCGTTSAPLRWPPKPYEDAPMLDQTVKGLRRATATTTPVRRKLPITANLLVAILCPDTYPLTTPDNRLFAACATLGFFGFLRCGEFTAKTTRRSPQITPTVIQRQDLRFLGPQNNQTMQLLLRTSKTDPFGQGVTVNIGNTDNTFPCPVGAMKCYLLLFGGEMEPSAPLLQRNGQQVTRAWFTTQLKSRVNALGIDARRYSGHSLRIGAATTAGAAGIPDHLIKTMGRWTSEAYHTYIRVPADRLCSTARILAATTRRRTNDHTTTARHDNHN